MKCRRAKKLIFDFVDGMINDKDRLSLEQHLTECGSCEQMASSLSKSLDLLHRVPSEPLDDNFAWKVRLQIAREKKVSSERLTTPHVWVRAWNKRFALSAVSAFAAIVVIGYVAIRTPLSPVTDSAPVQPTLTEKPRPQATLDNARVASNQSDVPSFPNIAGPTRFPVPQLVTDTDARELGGSRLQPVQEDMSPLVLDLDKYRQQFREGRRADVLREQVEILQAQLRRCEADCDK